MHRTAPCIFLLALFAIPVIAADRSGDPHYIDTGFFDIHVCNWPDRPPFYLAVFSTERYDSIASVNIVDNHGRSLGELDLTRYKIIERKNKPVKRAFISHIPVGTQYTDGWFSAQVRLKDNKIEIARDKVVHSVLSRVTHTMPADHAELSGVPAQLRWEPVAGAGYYQVFIRDAWDDDRLVYSSKLIAENALEPTAGVLKPGGAYSWKVHARDVNEDMELGDFNAGSQSAWVEFSILEP